MNVTTEDEMRGAQAPHPRSPKELQSYIAELVHREHDYGTCVYAMSLAATATFNYVAQELGATGFQASCADMDFLRRTRGYKGPFMIVNAEQALFPQHDLFETLREAMTKWQPWLAEQAAAKLLSSGGCAHPNVIAHWEALAATRPPANRTKESYT